jgi:hypothetical protein
MTKKRKTVKKPVPSPMPGVTLKKLSSPFFLSLEYSLYLLETASMCSQHVVVVFNDEVVVGVAELCSDPIQMQENLAAVISESVKHDVALLAGRLASAL